MPLGVIVTIAGTGSESNGTAIITNEERKVQCGPMVSGGFAIHVWGMSVKENSDEEIAKAGIEALTGFIKEIGLPVTMQELGVNKSVDLQAVADSCAVLPGSG